MTEETKKQAIEDLSVVVERLDNIKAENTKDHLQIFEQVKKTNGTVADLVRWKERMLGAIVIMNIIIVPIIISVMIKFTIDNLFK
jgi:ABC-type phosphate transport system permease subunit